jgi:hypothetical protein
MEVLVSSADGALRLTFVGQVDEAAPVIASAAVAAARGDGVALHVDTRRARPVGSPILAGVRRVLLSAAPDVAVVVR